ncbi:MAG TPA: hypothetical protein VEG34_14675 [Thermoanaerobaculia bacterium]|nr:hypothetical protein [Thermoanaerobaculia bacterium]
MALRRITRDRPLTAEEAAEYRKVREQVAEELPDLVARHHEHQVSLDQVAESIRHSKPLAKRRD